MPQPVPSLRRLRELAGGYDAIISDVWGVLHNGLVATPGAAEALTQARQAGLAVVLLTNAPRPPDSIRIQLRELGVADASYDAIVSSGGVTRTLIAEQGSRPFHHVGPARDLAVFEGLAAVPAPIAEAEYVLCTGLVDDEAEQAEAYRPLLDAALARRLPLYCANPDLVVERGSRIIPCAGAIAELYHHMGGETIWVGKPYPLVYQRARSEIARILGREVAATRVLCIGDALRTDIAGAHAAGHDSIMTLAGIHAHQIGLEGATYQPEALEALIAANGVRPTLTMPSLSW